MGWTMACGSAKIAADLIFGRKPEIDVFQFSSCLQLNWGNFVIQNAICDRIEYRSNAKFANFLVIENR